jgi:hypothetical protein
MAMDMEMAVIPTTVNTDSAATLEAVESNEIRKQRNPSETLPSAVGPRDWRSCMERTAQQPAHKLAQLHRPVAKMAHILETQTALQEAQWRGMKT